jgi:ribosomal protein L29
MKVKDFREMNATELTKKLLYSKKSYLTLDFNLLLASWKIQCGLKKLKRALLELRQFSVSKKLNKRSVLINVLK